MGLQLGETAPDFAAQTTEGTIRFHEWIGDSWAVLFSHPKDFTPICTTELGLCGEAEPRVPASECEAHRPVSGLPRGPLPVA